VHQHVFRGGNSAYWVPAAFMVDPQTKNTIHLAAHMNVYYQFNKTNNSLGQINLSAMTQGLQMFLDGSRPEFRQQIRLGCAQYLDSNGKVQQTPNFDPKSVVLPADRCVHVLARFLMPNCWNGKLTSQDFISHLSYPGPNRLCPTSHPIPIPRLVLNYDIYFPFPVSWGADPMYLPFFFANGQYNSKSKAVTYGLHADFIGGWDLNVFTYLTRKCYKFLTHDCGHGQGQKFYDFDSAKKCFSERRPYQIADTQRPNVDLLKIDFQGIDQPDACLNLGSDNQMCIRRLGNVVW
jgi:hypothetical protein